LLQGFPQNFKLPKNLADSKLYHQAGNSVTISVVQRIAENMKIVLEGGRVNPQTALLEIMLPNS
ncbi:MAG: DNA cytosine methyltransferase, partial [Nanoarchaeota archaeon]|nr:DNA cytosine methyltransferase [Nanoarchaeota archaeon]